MKSWPANQIDNFLCDNNTTGYQIINPDNRNNKLIETNWLTFIPPEIITYGSSDYFKGKRIYLTPVNSRNTRSMFWRISLATHIVSLEEPKIIIIVNLN